MIQSPPAPNRLPMRACLNRLQVRHYPPATLGGQGFERIYRRRHAGRDRYPKRRKSGVGTLVLKSERGLDLTVSAFRHLNLRNTFYAFVDSHRVRATFSLYFAMFKLFVALSCISFQVSGLAGFPPRKIRMLVSASPE